MEEPNENDRSKLVRVMNFPRVTVDEVLILEADNCGGPHLGMVVEA